MVILCNRCSSSVRQSLCVCVCVWSEQLFSSKMCLHASAAGHFLSKNHRLSDHSWRQGDTCRPLISPVVTLPYIQQEADKKTCLTQQTKLYITDKIWLERFTSGIWAALQVQQILTPQASCIQMFAAHKDFVLVFFFCCFFAREHKNKVKTIRSRASAGLSSSLSSEVSQAQAHSDIFISSFDWVDRVWTLAWTSIWRTQ